MNHNLNEDLNSRSIELEELSKMMPDDRIARIVWSRIQNDLENKDSLIYGIQYCISNIYHFIKIQIKENAQTRCALISCRELIEHLGWKPEDVFAQDCSKTIFIDYIKEVVAMYTDTRQHHCEEAQCILAINMIHMVLHDIEYVIKKRPAQEKRLIPAMKIAADLRNQMLNIFGYQPTKKDTSLE